MVTLSQCVDLISLKIACDFVMNSVHYSKNTSSGKMAWQLNQNIHQAYGAIKMSLLVSYNLQLLV